jgi:hypothetical protein
MDLMHENIVCPEFKIHFDISSDQITIQKVETQNKRERNQAIEEPSKSVSK